MHIFRCRVATAPVTMQLYFCERKSLNNAAAAAFVVVVDVAVTVKRTSEGYTYI